MTNPLIERVHSALFLMLCLSACAGGGDPDQRMSEAPEQPAPSLSSEPSPSTLAGEPSSPTPAQPSAEEAAAEADESSAAPAQARIFGVGTSCSPNPCQNGGTCVDEWLGHSCRCPSGYTGMNCQTRSGGTSSLCGDGIVQAGEECELGVGGWTAATCRPTCTRVYYGRCSNTSQCAAGEHCGFTGGVCSSWFNGASCPSVPGYATWVTPGGMCGVRCGASGSCPAGLRCATAYGFCLQDTRCCGPDYGCEPCFWPHAN